MSEIKFTIVVKAPKVPAISLETLRKNLSPSRLGVDSESDNELRKRVVRVHHKFSLERKRIDSKFKGKNADLSKYHSELFQMAQAQFGETLVANWRKLYLTIDGERRFPILIGPF